MSKVCFENTKVNSLRYSGTEVVASIFVWKASASLCKMVDEAQIQISIEGGGIRPVARIRSPSSMERGSSSESTSATSESSSESWFTSGVGPQEQVSILLTSAFQVIHSRRSSSLHSEQHLRGHLDILTSPLFQSISRLCFRSVMFLYHRSTPFPSLCVS